MLGFGGGFGSFGGGGLGFGSGFEPLGVWDLDYSQAASGGSGDGGGFWGNVGDSITDFLGGGESGKAISEGADQAVADVIAKGVQELYDVVGIDKQQSNASTGSGSGSGSGSGDSEMPIPSWVAPVGIVVAALFVIELVTS